MLFGTGLLVAGGVTIVVAVIDKACDDLGYQWVGTAIKILLPIAGFALGIYFLESNPIVRWIK